MALCWQILEFSANPHRSPAPPFFLSLRYAWARVACLQTPVGLIARYRLGSLKSRGLALTTYDKDLKGADAVTAIHIKRADFLIYLDAW